MSTALQPRPGGIPGRWIDQLRLMAGTPNGRRIVNTAGVLIGVLLLWWLFGMSRVEERMRDEQVEMFDLAVPPPPPPPPPEEQVVDPEIVPEEVAVTASAAQPDPLSPPQPASANPPAGDLTSLMQDPTSSAPGRFTGGPRGQGGTGNGALIGGSGRGAAAASRAYAEIVQRALMRQLRRRPDLAQAAFTFQVRLRVSGNGQLEILGLSNVQPAELSDDLLEALRGLSRIDTPPPAGMPNQITLQLNQA